MKKIIMPLIILVVIVIVIASNYVFKGNSSNNNEYMPLADVDYEVSKVACESSVGMPGDTIQCYAYNSDGQQINSMLTWKSEGLATVDQTGLVTIKNSDTPFPDSIHIYITASTGLKEASYTIRWGGSKVEATKIEFDVSEKKLEVEEEFVLTPTIYPEDVTDKMITWDSSDPSVATVYNGKVLAIGGGEAIITAKTSNGKTATCKIIVDVPIIDIKLFTEKETMIIGEVFTLTPTILPSNATDKKITWESSDDYVVKVVTIGDIQGKFTALSKGTVTITATTSNDISSSFVIEVKEVPVTEITLSKTSLTLTKGASETLIATVLPDNATDKTVTWSSNATVATVDSNGKVTAHRAGTATITAMTPNGKKATCTVTVNETGETIVPVESITLSATSKTLKVNESFTLTATVNPSNATDKTVKWISNNPSVAAVSEGVVTAIGVGEALITARIGEIYARANITVTKNDSIIVNVTNIVLDKSNISLKIGDNAKLNVTINPNNATNKNVVWTSSDSNIVSVDQNGNIKALKSGKATISVSSASDTTKTASCIVTVSDEPSGETNISVTGISLKDTSLTLKINEKYKMLATIVPDNATNKDVIWESSDESVASINEDGEIITKKLGKATITVTTLDGQKKATCQLTVISDNNVDVPITSLDTPTIILIGSIILGIIGSIIIYFAKKINFVKKYN